MWDEQQTLEEEATGGLERLRKQERVWFSWVCRLHDLHAGIQTPQSAAILSVARRRWAEARRALARTEARVLRSRDAFERSEARVQSSD